MPFAILALAALIALFWGLASALAHLFWSHGAWRIVDARDLPQPPPNTRAAPSSPAFPSICWAMRSPPTTEMMQLASIIGVYGLTALAALLAMTPALIWPADGRGMAARLVPFFLAVGVIAAQIGYGNVRLNSTLVTPRTDMNVRLVQPIITEHSNWAAANPPDIVTG